MKWQCREVMREKGRTKSAMERDGLMDSSMKILRRSQEMEGMKHSVSLCHTQQQTQKIKTNSELKDRV